MSKFVYSMQNILVIKEKLEGQAKNEFAKANVRVMEEEEKLRHCHEKRDALTDYLKDLLLASHLDIQKIEETKRLVTFAEEQIRAQTIQVRMAEKKLEEKRILMQKAMQEKKTQEILREKAFDVFVQEEKAAENKEIDQLTSYVHGQKIKGR